MKTEMEEYSGYGSLRGISRRQEPEGGREKVGREIEIVEISDDED